MNTVSPLTRHDGFPIDDGGLESLPGGAPPPAPDAEARARALATVNYDAFAAGKLIAPHPCNDFTDGEEHDFDRCVTDRMVDAPLSVKQEGDRSAIDPKDVQQFKLGDCFVLAPVAALASTEEGRALIEKAIVPNKNEKGEVTSYTVTLHEPETHWFRATTFTEKKVTVDPVFAVGHADPVRPGLPGAEKEIWPLVLEKAFAEYLGGYNKLHQGGLPALAMELLTGKPADTKGLFLFWSYGPRELAKDLSEGKMVVLNTEPGLDSGNAYDLIKSHSYQVTGTQTVNGKLCVTLHNPWNKDEPKPVPFDELHTWFDNVAVGSVR
jgi:hypothetical protein